MHWKKIILPVFILLLIPLIAMQFTDEVKWSMWDFIIASILLLATSIAVNYIFTYIVTTWLKLLLSIVVLALFLVIWLELAVGIF